jgi:GAF domain-containing protein
MVQSEVVLCFDQMLGHEKTFGRFMALSNLLSQAKNLKEIINDSLKIVLREFSLDAGRVYLFDPVQGNFFLASYEGIDVSGLERVRMGQGFTGKAAELRSFIAFRVEQLEDKARVQLLQSKGLKIIYCVPFVVMNKVEGVMNLGSMHHEMMSDREMELLFLMGHQIGVAIAHARLYEALNEKINLLEDRK